MNQSISPNNPETYQLDPAIAAELEAGTSSNSASETEGNRGGAGS